MDLGVGDYLDAVIRGELFKAARGKLFAIERFGCMC